MSKKVFSQDGVAHLMVAIVLVLLVVVSFVGWRLVSQSKAHTATPASREVNTTDSSPNARSGGSSIIAWSHNGTEWVKNGSVPACQNPLTIQLPVDISKATAILYPGQYRGGNYKPHGGFIFNGSPNAAISVTVPQDANVYKGSRYIESGETQYMFVLIAPCGIMYRFDHLLTLSSTFQKLADTLPAAKENNSETTNFQTAPAVKANDVIATAVGFKNSGNTSVDFGVYDLRAKNEVSKTTAWQSAHPTDNEYGAYALCWLNNLTGSDKTKALALPGGDGQAGKQSDYCK